MPQQVSVFIARVREARGAVTFDVDKWFEATPTQWAAVNLAALRMMMVIAVGPDYLIRGDSFCLRK